MPELTIKDLHEIARGHWIRRALAVSIELDFYSRIKKGINTAERMAEDLGTEVRGVERLLNACVALGFLKKGNGVYENTSLSERYLVKESPDYFGDSVIMNDSRAKRWDLLKESILKGSPPERKPVDFENPVFTKAMHNNGVQSARLLGEKFDFSNYKNLLDLGGGSGVFSIELTNKYKNLKAMIFELPGVCKTAEEYIDRLGDSSRIKTFAGDFLKDKLQKGFDVVLISQIFHSYSDEDCKSILKKVYDVLPEKGIVIINEFLLNPDKISPVFPVLFSLNMFMNSKGGSAYTREEIEGWLKKSGFEIIEVISLGELATSIIAKRV